MNSKKHEVPLICDLDLNKYVGKWYEIGKLSTWAQNGLDNVSATYSLKDNVKIKVYNEGFRNGKKKKITGSAWLRKETCTGGLYVRFFWPFKSQYNIIKLAHDYRYAIVMGNNRKSLWILSRTSKMKSRDYKKIIHFLKDKGFKIDEIMRTKQNMNH